ncbi:hypothetical protein CRM22_005520, partial [Opisthorchis felineus]
KKYRHAVKKAAGTTSYTAATPAADSRILSLVFVELSGKLSLQFVNASMEKNFE